MYFHVSMGEEELGGRPTALLNPAEARIAEATIRKLLRLGHSPENIGVIAMYDAQVTYITELLERFVAC